MSLETYNNDETRTDDIEKEVLDKTGLESKPINDYLRHHESEERGTILINLDSDSMLEEDIAQVEKGNTILDASRHTEIVEASFSDTLKTLGGYIPQEKLQRLFPKLDMNNLDSYDFSLSKIKVFILSNDSYEFFNSNLYPDKDAKSSGGFTKSTVRSNSGVSGRNEMRVDMSEKKIIVVKELPEPVKDRIERTNGKLPRELTDAEKDLVALNIKATVVHELLHDLDVSIYLPKPLNEGITEWYAQQVTYGEVKDEDIFEERGVWIGYKRETEAVSILINAMLENGINMDVIDKAFLSNNEEATKEVSDFLESRYGVEQVGKIINWEFESPRKSLQFIVDLEAKQDSNIGKFLRNYKK